MDLGNLNSILKKTEKGLNALKVRNPLLAQKSRVLLILIDGKKTIGELAPLLTVGSDTHEKFSELLQAGFVAEVLQLEVLQTQLDANSTGITINKTDITNSVQNLQVAIRAACRMLTDILGPNSDVLSMQLEKCKTKDEFNAKILEFRKIVGTMRTEKHGDEFVKAAIF
jgi:hypothetical protein